MFLILVNFLFVICCLQTKLTLTVHSTDKHVTKILFKDLVLPYYFSLGAYIVK